MPIIKGRAAGPGDGVMLGMEERPVAFPPSEREMSKGCIFVPATLSDWNYPTLRSCKLYVQWFKLSLIWDLTGYVPDRGSRTPRRPSLGAKLRSCWAFT